MPIDQNIRRLRTKLQNLIMLALVDRAGKRYQILGAGDQARPDVAYMQPQGLHFRAPAQAKGVVLCPAATPENAVLINAQGSTPADTLAEGEGGLHYLGTFKVYCKANGEVHLAGGTAAADFVALAQKVDTAIANIRTFINTHTHSAPGGVTGVPSPLLGAQASTAASKVKAT